MKRFEISSKEMLLLKGRDGAAGGALDGAGGIDGNSNTWLITDEERTTI